MDQAIQEQIENEIIQGQEVYLTVLVYELTRLELEETDELCHGNWIEIQHQREYIELLQKTLKQNGIDVPSETMHYCIGVLI